MRRLLPLLALVACTRSETVAQATDAAADSPADAVVTPGPWLREHALPSSRSPSAFVTLDDRFVGGVCAFDADLDGRLDLFFAEGNKARLLVARGAAFAFVDETAARGLSGVSAGGCLATDLDGDGDADLVTLGFGRVRLFRNDGGKMVEASDRFPAGVFDSTHLYAAAVAFDADGDGDLDLAIGSYGRYVAPDDPSKCVVTCEINNGNWHDGHVALLLRRDDGSYEDASTRIQRLDEKILVLLATDLDEDGAIDLFVGVDDPRAGDRYLRRKADGAFEDAAIDLEIAWNSRKNGVSSMSLFDADVDGDGHLDLLQSSWDDDPNTLYRCFGGKVPCRDVGDDLELFRTPKNLRWGQAMVDLDDDGVLEIFEAAGHIYGKPDVLPGASPPPFGPLEERTLLWHRRDATRPFALEPADGALATKLAGRGVVAADLDADGDLDLVVSTAFGAPRIFENVRVPRGRFLDVELVGKAPNLRAIGARVEVHAPKTVRPALVHAGVGYRSSVDAPLHFGTGAVARVAVVVRWPSGKRTTLDDVGTNAKVTIAEP